ncbi:MAG: hypothetical protein AAFQ62_06160 [Pseudomonadota bacterium]
MNARRLAAYITGLALMMVGLVAIERFSDAGLSLLVPSRFATTMGTSEYSVVEWLQVVMLVFIAVLAWHSARVSRLYRSLSLIWLAIACAAICRELDLFLDGYLFDHAWQILVAMIGVAAIVHGLRHKRALSAAWTRAINELATPIIFLGIAITVIFANALGSEGLWLSLMGDDYQRVAKIAAEEIAELAGYWMWLVGQIEFSLAAPRQHVPRERKERRKKERRRR